MLTGIQIRKFMYPEGTVLSSKQDRYLPPRSMVRVGSCIVVPFEVRKLIVHSSYCGMELRHMFLQFGNERELYPVYLRIQDAFSSDAKVLLFKHSLDTIYTRFGATEKTPVKNKIMEGVSDHFQYISGLQEASDILDGFITEDYDDSLINDSAILLSNNDDALTYMDSDKQVKFDVSDANTYRLIPNISSYLTDIILREYENGTFGDYPITRELEDIFNPDMGEVYSDHKYDNITQNVLKDTVTDPVLFKRQVIGNRVISCFSDSEKWHTEEVIYPKTFSSNLLCLSVFIHSLPVSELAFTYILPSRSTPWKIKIHRVSSLVRHNDLLSKLSMLLDLSVTWSESIRSVDCIYTSSEELWVYVHGTQEYVIYIDMAVTALLSQSLYGGN